MSNERKYKYFNIGTILRGKKENPQDADWFYIKLKQDTDSNGKPYGDQVFPITLANGIVLNVGDSLSLFSIPEKFKAKVEAGEMTQEKADELDYLKFEVKVKQPLNAAKKSGSGEPNF